VPCGERPGEGNRVPRNSEEFRAAGARGPIRFALLLSSFVILNSSFLLAGWVAENSTELTTQGDWNGDGNPDLLVLDRDTGSLRVGLANGTAIDWQEPIPTGVENATSIAFGQFTYAGLPKVGLAVTSPLLNRVQVIHPLIAEPQALVMQGLGPNALVSMQGGPAVGGNLIAASTLNAEPTPWHLTQIGSTDSTPGDALLERGNEIASDFYGFIARQQPVESFRLHQFSAGALYPQAQKTAPGVPAGADWVTGQFTATVSKREYLFWQSGQTILHVRTFDQAAAPPDFNAGVNFDLGQVIDEVAVLTGTTPPRLLVIFGGGTSAGVFDFDGVNAPVLAHTLTPEPGQTFRNALAANGGDFHLLSGALGSPTSDSARRWRRQGNGNYIADPASAMPVLRPGSRRTNLLLYVGEPFVDDNARLVSSLNARDWTTAANGVPQMIQATAEIFQNSTDGLGQSQGISLGKSSTPATHSLPSQYADDVSISIFAPPVGTSAPSLHFNPAPGRYAAPVNVALVSDAPSSQIQYRLGATGAWQNYNPDTRIAMTSGEIVQAYATGTDGQQGAIITGEYIIGSSSAAPTTLAATDITTTSATLRGTVDPNGVAATAAFDYGTTAALGTSTSAQSVGSGTAAVPVSQSITGLLPHTTYHFRINATTNEGTNLGTKRTFITANSQPVIADASFNGTEDLSFNANITGTDADNDTLTFTQLSAPAHGLLYLYPGGTFFYTPALNFHGTDSFQVTGKDDFGGEDIATITVNIAPVNDLPIALGQNLSAPGSAPVPITLTATDVDNDPLIWEIVTQPAYGSLTGTPPSIVYTPDSLLYPGVDSFTFRVKDAANVFSAPARVTITDSNLPIVQPTISGTAALAIPKSSISPWINFTVGPVAHLATIAVTAESNNPTLLPVSGIEFEGTGPVRRMRLKPVCGLTGQVVITLTATRGALSATTDFSVNVVEGQGAGIIGIGYTHPPVGYNYNESNARDVSADGSVIASYGPSRWTEQGGIENLDPSGTYSDFRPYAISADGGVIVGEGQSALNPYSNRGVLWDHGVYTRLPESSIPLDVSGDGSLVVGLRETIFYNSQGQPGGVGFLPIKWTQAGGMVDLPLNPGAGNGMARGVSADGSLIVGGFENALVWQTSGGPPLVLPALPDSIQRCTATAVSADGSIIVGSATTANGNNPVAVRWLRDSSTGSYSIEMLTSTTDTEARSVSADGSRIVGYNNTEGPWIWDAIHGMRLLRNVLIDAGVDVNAWGQVVEANAISADGRYVVGVGAHADGFFEGYRIELPHDPATPVISPIANLSTAEITPTPAIPFTLTDVDTNPACLELSAESSNPGLVPVANIVFSGSGASRTVTVTPAPGQSGLALIVITVNDGFSTSMEEFELNVTPSNPYNAWRLLHFGAIGSTGNAELTGDPDNDGRINLEEFAFGLDPRSGADDPVMFANGVVTQRGDPLPLATGPPNDPPFMAVFCRRVDWQAAGLSYTVLFSANLIDKVPSSTLPDVLATDGEIEVVGILYPAAIEVGGQNVVPKFFQVQITKNP
jgi:uncharacterized membrane protein